MSQTLITNVRIFDGCNDSLSAASNVLVTGNTIEKISSDPIQTEGDAKVIDGGGRTLMPGMIDAHVHMDINMDFAKVASVADRSDLAIRSVVRARHMLMDGFTTVRDVGGSPFALKLGCTAAGAH